MSAKPFANTPNAASLPTALPAPAVMTAVTTTLSPSHPKAVVSAVAQVQATLRKRILRAFVARGLLEKADAKEMLAYQHSGFSVDAGVCIEAHDRAALERLLRYCARPPFGLNWSANTDPQLQAAAPPQRLRSGYLQR